MDQPGKVANPARGQLNRENNFPLSPCVRLRIWSREMGSAVPSRVSLLIFILRLNLVLTAAELGKNPVSKHQIQPEYGDEQADAGRDG